MQEQILYFEDDRKLAKVVCEFLNKERYQVSHYVGLPQGGLDELVSLVKTPPFLVLMDIRLDNGNGFDICRAFKQHAFFAEVPVIFMSGLIGEDDILKAYDAGAYDYLTKPIKFKTLSAKCRTIHQFHAQANDLRQQVSSVESVAFDAMTTSSELGCILRFHEKIVHISTLENLADELAKQITTFGVSASVMVTGTDGVDIYHSDDDKVYELEKSVFNMLKGQGRIYSWNHRVIFNYECFSVLIRNMPVDDDVRDGMLKDQICLLLNGVESRVKAIYNEYQLRVNQDNIGLIAQTIGKMVVDLQDSNLSLSGQFEKIVHELEEDVSKDFTRMNLMQSEEQVVIDHIHNALGEALAIFNQVKAKDTGYTKVLVELLEQLP